MTPSAARRAGAWAVLALVLAACSPDDARGPGAPQPAPAPEKRLTRLEKLQLEAQQRTEAEGKK